MFIYSEEVKIFLNITLSSEAVIEEYDYIQIKYFLFIHPMKMIWVPVLCQTVVHPAFTGCIAQ